MQPNDLYRHFYEAQRILDTPVIKQPDDKRLRFYEAK